MIAAKNEKQIHLNFSISIQNTFQNITLLIGHNIIFYAAIVFSEIISGGKGQIKATSGFGKVLALKSLAMLYDNLPFSHHGQGQDHKIIMY